MAMTQDTGLLFAEKQRDIHGMQLRIRDPSKSRDLAFESCVESRVDVTL